MHILFILAMAFTVLTSEEDPASFTTVYAPQVVVGYQSADGKIHMHSEGRAAVPLTITGEPSRSAPLGWGGAASR